MLRDDKRRSQTGQMILALAVLLLATSCQPQATPQPEALSIKIDSPASGMHMRMEETPIQSTASGPGGVSWIELWVDGELMDTTQAPTPLQPKFSAIQRWRATSPGEHLIEVRAYDENGVASSPANIVLRVSSEDLEERETPVPERGDRVPTVTRPPAAAHSALTATVPACEPGSRYVADVTVPDDTRFVTGTEFEKTWRVLNTGTCPWSSDYNLVFVKGDQMGGPNRVSIPQADPETEADLSVSLVAPSEPGTYSGYWRVSSLHGDPFGSTLFVKIVVVSPTATPKPTARATPTPASTASISG